MDWELGVLAQAAQAAQAESGPRASCTDGWCWELGIAGSCCQEKLGNKTSTLEYRPEVYALCYHDIHLRGYH